MDKVRLAAVGVGRWAHVLARAAQRGDVMELASCFSRSEEKGAAFAAEFGIPRSASTYEELLADPEIEGVLITTPNDTHKAFIVQAAEAGLAVNNCAGAVLLMLAHHRGQKVIMSRGELALPELADSVAQAGRDSIKSVGPVLRGGTSSAAG